MTFGVAIILIIVSIAPCFMPRGVTATNDYIEITTQVYGLKEVKGATIQLTTQQYQELETYLIEFRAHLNQSTTKETTDSLFKEAILELNKYQLLPQGMHIQQVNDLITANIKNAQQTMLLSGLPRISDFLNHTNAFCFIAGETTMNTRFFGILEMGSSALCWILSFFSLIARHNGNDPVFLNTTLTFINSLRNIIYKINAKRIIGTGIITFGHSHTSSIPPPYRYDPAQGWITSLGLLGKKSWNGTFFGRLLFMAPYDSYLVYPGAMGFVGIKLNRRDGTFFFIGSSAVVSIK